MEEQIKDGDIVRAFINVVNRIKKLEVKIGNKNVVEELAEIRKELSVVQAVLNISTSKYDASEVARSKWEEWSRKIILKVVEWFIVIVGAIVGIKSFVSGL